MTPTTVLKNQLLTLIAADGTTLSPAALSELLVKLVVSAFTPEDGLVPADVTLATFTGSAPMTIVAGDQEVAHDVVRDQWFLQIVEPAGGFFWVCTVAPDPAQRVYGAILTNQAGTVIYASELLGTSVLISAIGDSVTIPSLRLYMSDFVAPG